MPRTLSAAFLAKLVSQTHDEGLVPFLTCTWDDGVHADTMRIVQHDENATLDGQTHIAASFMADYPEESETLTAGLPLAVQDATREVRDALRQLDTRYPATARIDFCLASAMPTVLTASGHVQITFEGPIRTLSLGPVVTLASVQIFDDLRREPWTVVNMTPAHGFNALRGAR